MKFSNDIFPKPARHMRKCGKSDNDKNDVNNNASAANCDDDLPCDKCDAKFDTNKSCIHIEEFMILSYVQIVEK